MSGQDPGGKSPYTKYRARPGLLGRLRPGTPTDAVGQLRHHRGASPGGAPAPYTPHRRRRPVTGRRVVKWLLVALAAWLGISLLLFLVSAQIQQGKVDDATENALAGGGVPLGSPTTILVLGSDQRSTETAEPGSSTTARGRSDSILLLRVGGGANRRLSIARDTMAEIPGAGRQKINAAYAIGGAPLAVRTIGAYLDTDIDHLIEVSFADFPDLIDAMGGIDYKGGCVVAKVNGGYRNGGVTLRIKAGETERLNGKQALALARVRKNACNPRENDLTRARRQQRILSAMRTRLMRAGFFRLPLVAWQVPRTFRTDMSGPTLLAVFASIAVGGTPDTEVLGTVDGNVPEDRRRRAVETFVGG